MTPEKFLKELKAHNKEQFDIVSEVRKLILKNNAHAQEEIKYGGLLYSDSRSDKESYTGLFVYKSHVSIEFADGHSFLDPKKLLQGNGKYRRHLKCKKLDDVDKKEVMHFLQQAENSTIS